MALKRQTWDHTVLLTVATGLGGIPQTLSFDRSDLVDFAFFRNLPLPDDEDCVRVDLVEGKMSPWPVDGAALEALLHLCSPMAMFCTDGDECPSLYSIMMDHETCMMRLLDTAEALVLDFRGREALAHRFDDVIAEFVADRDLLHIGVHDAAGQQTASADANYAQHWVQAENGQWVLDAAFDSGADVEHCRAQLTPEVLLPVARWAAGQLYRMLDKLTLHKAQVTLAQRIVNPCNKLLLGDERWRRQLKEWAVDPQLSASGRGNLFDVALNADAYDCYPSYLRPYEELLAIDCTRAEIFHKHGVQLAPDVKLVMGCWTANSMDVGLELITPRE